MLPIYRIVIASLLGAGISHAAGSLSATQRDVAPAESGGPTQGAGTCGAPGQPPCPLQAWMRANLAAQLASNNTAALASGLDSLERLNPDPAWGTWTTIARAGADAARSGDVRGARASCKGCHTAWREQYKARFRSRSVPK